MERKHTFRNFSGLYGAGLKRKTPRPQNQVASLAEHGYLMLENVFQDAELQELVEAIETMRNAAAVLCAPGVRQLLQTCPTTRAFATAHPLIDIVSAVLGAGARPVRAILFDKSPAANWYVTWHKDLSIPVKHRIDVPGFGPWSTKEGITHVQPPVAILGGMLSARIHLDDCDLENGPIKFIPGSHKGGILEPSQIDSRRAAGDFVSCPV